MNLNDRARKRLTRNTIGWLTTVTASGRPQTSPVWFLWEGTDEILIYSLDKTARVRNIGRNPAVAFNLDSDGHGGDIVTIEGRARIDRDHRAASEVAAYVDKYRGYMNVNGWTPEWFSGRYPVPIVVGIDRVRAP